MVPRPTFTACAVYFSEWVTPSSSATLTLAPRLYPYSTLAKIEGENAFSKPSVGKKIAARRKELGISHQRLADNARLDRSTISLIENEKRIPSLFTILKICSVLRLSLADLLKQYNLK